MQDLSVNLLLLTRAGNSSANNAIELFTSKSHCVLLYLIPFEEDASDFLIFWSTHMSQIGERKKIEILRWPSEIAC